MANILYGVSGEGFGHASRATEVARFLISEGHTLKIASYAKGYQALARLFDVVEIPGLRIATENNQVAKTKTFLGGFRSIKEILKNMPELKTTLIKDFKPDVVLCDFEPLTAHLAQHYDLPLVTLDNQHQMRYVALDCPKSYKKQALFTRSLIRLMVPKPDVALITSFHAGVIENPKAFVFPPILRTEVALLQPEKGMYTLVYMTQSFAGLLDLFSHFPREQFIVYGASEQEDRVNVQFKKPSQVGFLEDLRAAKCVIATAGLTLLTECLYLGKPLLAFPMQGQFEQIINGLELDRSGYGATAWQLDAAVLAQFFYRLPEYQLALQAYPHDADSAALKQKLRAILSLAPLTKATLKQLVVAKEGVV